MREVEVKIKISSSAETISLLESKGCVFGLPVVQRDTVYIPHEEPTVPCPPGTNVLRIRRQGGKKVFTLKQSDKHNHLSKLELETEVVDDTTLNEMIKLLGFKIIADTTKTRCSCKIDGYEICVDLVEDLGDYLEIEKITDEPPLQVQEQMLKFLSQQGIDISQQVKVGYDVLYVQKYGNA